MKLSGIKTSLFLYFIMLTGLLGQKVRQDTAEVAHKPATYCWIVPGTSAGATDHSIYIWFLKGT